MTDKQLHALLVSCRADLKKTQEGYKTHPNGTWWSKAMPKLDQAIKELGRPPVPALGPVLEGGLPILLHAMTHWTTGVGIPAFDTGFGQAGRWAIAPEALTVTDVDSAAGGEGFDALGSSGLPYWFGHLADAPSKGTRFRKGQRIGKIAYIPQHQGGPHLHVGIDGRPVMGRQFLWGEDGNGPPYTFGSPTIGAQLARGNV